MSLDGYWIIVGKEEEYFWSVAYNAVYQSWVYVSMIIYTRSHPCNLQSDPAPLAGAHCSSQTLHSIERWPRKWLLSLDKLCLCASASCKWNHCYILFMSGFFHSATSVRFIPVLYTISLSSVIDVNFPFKEKVTVFPSFCWWTFGLLPVFGYYEQCCCEYMDICWAVC